MRIGQMVQQAVPSREGRSGGRGGHARGSGRGGGVAGTRSRVDRMMSSVHHESAPSSPGRHTDQGYNGSKTHRRTTPSSPSHRAGRKGPDSRTQIAPSNPRSRAGGKTESGTRAGPSMPHLPTNRAGLLPVRTASTRSPHLRWIGTVAEQTNVAVQPEARPVVRMPPTR